MKTKANIPAERFYKHKGLVIDVVGFDDPAIVEHNYSMTTLQNMTFRHALWPKARSMLLRFLFSGFWAARKAASGTARSRSRRGAE